MGNTNIQRVIFEQYNVMAKLKLAMFEMDKLKRNKLLFQYKYVIYIFIFISSEEIMRIKTTKTLFMASKIELKKKSAITIQAWGAI